MSVVEGRGFLLRSGSDAPYSGWITARWLDASVPIQAAPWMVIQTLSELAQLLPGGLSFLWDLPDQSLSSLPHEVRAAFWSALGHLPGLTLHVREESFAEHIESPLHGWFHAPRAPKGAMGHAWRQGWIGWMPEMDSAWSLPSIGKVAGLPESTDEIPPGCHWGEVILPLGALGEIDVEHVTAVIEDVQAGLEKNLSLRMSAQAWPTVFPFQRRRTGWRLAILGGREYQSANGNWETAAEQLRVFADNLSGKLKCPIQIGPSHDHDAASLLGHQAMREGFPWRYSLPIPPASPTFTPGLGADPREAAPLESRAAFPDPLAPLLAHPPIAFLRVPSLPQDAAVDGFLQRLNQVPAIRWIPPGVPPPGPFTQERIWAASGAFVPLIDTSRTVQPSLFDDPETPGGDSD